MFGEGFRYTEGNPDRGRVRGGFRHVAEAPLDLANILQIVVQQGAIGCWKIAVQSRHFQRYRIQEAGLGLFAGRSFLSVAPVAEQPLKNDLRVGFEGKRFRRACP